MPEGIDIAGKIKMKSLSELRPYEKNPKTHTHDQISKLAETFSKYGFDVPIVIDKENTIIKGHARYEAAKRLKMRKVPTICREELTPQEVRAARVADNKVSEAYWDMPSLIYELEALYNLDDPGVPITDTGFSELEIRGLLPSLLDDDSDERRYKIAPATAGGFVAFSHRIRQDGKVGNPVSILKEAGEEEVYSHFSDIIVPCFGDIHGIAVLLSAVSFEPKKVRLLYGTPGCSQFKCTVPYLQYMANKLGARFVDVSPVDDKEYKGRISAQGFPSEKNLWDEALVLGRIEDYMRKENLFGPTTLMVLGAENSAMYDPVFRRLCLFEGSYYCFCPFLEFVGSALYEFVEKNLPPKTGLHPYYAHIGTISYPSSPLLLAKDYLWMKTTPEMFPYWLGAIEYFALSKRNRSYRYSGHFDYMLKTMIAEGIDPWMLLPYSDLAMSGELLEEYSAS